MKSSAPRPAPSGGPTSARRKASSSVANATAVSATRKKANAAAKPDGAAGRSTAMSSASGSSVATAAAAYQRHSARWRVAAMAAPQAATPARSATAAARSSRHSWARRASLPSQISAAAQAAPSAKPLATSGTRRRERAGPQEKPSGRRAASSTTSAHAPAASETAVPPARGCTPERRGRLQAVTTRDAASARRARHERSGELDMALAHADRPRPQVHEQRAVGPEPDGAAYGRLAQLAAAQPVTPREGRAFPLRERRLKRGDADQRRHQPIQHVDAPHVRETLVQRHGATRDCRGQGIAHVDADADGKPLEPVPLPATLAQNPGDLTVIEQHIVGPLEPRDRAAEQRIHGVRDRETRPDGDRPPRPPRHSSPSLSRSDVLRAEQQAKPHASGRRMPGASVAAAPGALLLGDHRRSRGRPERAEVVDRVQRGGEPVEQPALRHAPSRRELRRRNAIQR